MDVNIKLIRTADNVDYIGDVKEELGKIIVTRCLHVFVQESQNPEARGTFQIGFMPPVHPALGVIDEQARGAADIEFFSTGVKFLSPPNEQLTAMYREAVSGIAIAKIIPASKM